MQCKQSKFFEAAFNESFAEASNGVVNLPEERPRTFEIVHTWLYTGELTRAIGTEDVECTPNHNIELYVFGDKYAMPELCNKAMDQLIRYYEKKGVVETNMAFVYRKIVDGSPLWRLFVAIITCVPARSEVFMQKYAEPFWEYPQCLMDVNKALFQIIQGKIKPPQLSSYS